MAQYKTGPSAWIFFILGGTFLFGSVLVGALMVSVGLGVGGGRPPGRDFYAMFGGLACFFVVVGSLMIALNVWLLARRRKALPPDPNPAAWVAWALSQRSAWWKGEWEGRTVVAQRAFRKYGHGHIYLHVSAAVASRAVLIRRGGVAGGLGRALESVAGATVVSAATLGYPDFEVSMAEPEWAERVLGTPKAREAVQTLAALPTGASVVSISLNPGHLTLCHGFPSTGAVGELTASSCLQQLAALARIAEAQPGPRTPVLPSWSDGLALNPAKAQRVAYVIVFVLVGGIALAITVAALLAMALS